jgi:GTPase
VSAFGVAGSKDAPPNVAQIFVEPNEKGVWNAVYTLDAQLLDKNGKPKGKPVSFRYSMQEVVRVEAADLGKKIKEIPDDEIRAADTYKIYLKLDKGPVRQGFELLFRNGTRTGLIF